MKDLYPGGFGRAALMGAASLLLTASPAPSLAQRGSPGARAAERRIDTMNRQGEQYERDALIREREGPADAPGDRRRAQDRAEQVRRDFEGLQAGYNKIVLAMASKEPLDSDSVLGAVAEVRKCAARLRDSLALPRSKEGKADKGRAEAGGVKIEESLLALRKHIYSFVTNPLFEGQSALDVEQATKAGRDLDIILGLSDAIRGGGGRPEGRQD